jgi:hypothetical protein
MPNKKFQDESNKDRKESFRAMKKIESWFNPQATRAINDYNHGREITLDQIIFS